MHTGESEQFRGYAFREAAWLLGVLGLVFALGCVFLPLLAPFAALALGFVALFFRDPKREIPSAPGAVVAPADGVVTAVDEGVEIPGSDRRGVRISIFLSIFDVHINRSPVAGKVVETVAAGGLFLDARDPCSAWKNVSRSWVIEEEGSGRRVAVRQITGAIARRIVAWAREGDLLAKGQRFGMIRFGSRTDLFLPADVRVVVKAGERVRGGSTVVAQWQQ